MNILELIEKQKHFHTLSQPFYNDAEIFALECKHLIYDHWVYVCHESELNDTYGNFQVFNIGNESIILTHNDADEIEAFFNVCRHRGSRICNVKSGRSKKFTCPYHQWTYDFNGKFISGANVKKRRASAHDLHRCELKIFEGLIFVNVSKQPSDWSEIEFNLGSWSTRFNFRDLKVIKKKTWDVKANWKLVVENFRECYHCAGAHPEYTAINDHVDNQKDFLHKTDIGDSSFNEFQQKFIDTCNKYDMRYGHQYYADSPQPMRAFRQPINGVSDTMSKDGKPLARLLGDLEEYDGGELGIQFGSLSYLYAFNDHVVMFRYTPRSVNETEIELHWLVHKDADDYNVDDIVWLWDVTTEQDVNIIEGNQLGINSTRYEQSEYNANEERFTYQWVEWYLNYMKEKCS